MGSSVMRVLTSKERVSSAGDFDFKAESQDWPDIPATTSASWWVVR